MGDLLSRCGLSGFQKVAGACYRTQSMSHDTYLLEHHGTTTEHMRPYPQENIGSRSLSCNQACERSISSWVGDDQRIPTVACILLHFFCLPQLRGIHPCVLEDGVVSKTRFNYVFDDLMFPIRRGEACDVHFQWIFILLRCGILPDAPR